MCVGMLISPSWESQNVIARVMLSVMSELGKKLTPPSLEILPLWIFLTLVESYKFFFLEIIIILGMITSPSSVDIANAKMINENCINIVCG